MTRTISDYVVETIGPVEQEDGTVLVGRVILDEYGSTDLDCPRDDHSGEDAWEWIEWGNGRQRNEWIGNNFCCKECGAAGGYPDEACSSGYEEADKHIYPDAFRPGLDFWIERYEHGLVRYAPIGESSQVDRQWGVAQGVAIMRFTKPETIGPDDDPDRLLNFCRAVCDEYTSWCNGDIYGYTIHRWPTIAHYETDPDDGELIDSCWGFIGTDQHGDNYALEALKEAMT